MTKESRENTHTHSSETLPFLHEWYAVRDGMLDTLDFHVQNGARVLLLENHEGFGKTTALAQFAERHHRDSIALFLKAQDSLLCHPDAVRSDFLKQVRQVIAPEDKSDVVHTDDGLIRAALLQLSRKARKSQKPALFIVDGLEDLSESHILRDAVVPLLHLNTRDFVFVLSSRPGGAPIPIPGELTAHRASLQVMGKDELKKIFAAFSPSETQLDTIKQVTRGIPIKVGSVRRLLDTGATLEDVLSEVPQGADNFFESEWQSVMNGEDPTDQLLVALIVADQRSRTCIELAKLTGIGSDEVTARVLRLPFLFVDTQSATVRFESDSFRRFAAGKVQGQSAQAYELLIGELSQDETSPLALQLLPELYQRSSNHERLLAVLSPEHFGRMIDRADSLALVRHHAHLGVKAAELTEQEPELLRFGLQESAISAIEREAASRSAVEALLALGEMDSALLLAQQSPTVEDRLQLMSVVATARRRAGLPTDAALEGEIKRLAQGIDPGILGRRAVEIAADLITFSPTLALELVERASKETGSHGDMDWALARLSLAWTFANEQKTDSARVDDSLRARIADPAARRFASRVAASVAGSSAERVLSEAERFNEPEEKLYFLRNWLIHNIDRPDAGRVCEAALGLAVDTSAFSITADFLRDVAIPLARATDTACIKRCIAIIDNLKGTLSGRSMRLHLLELELALGTAEVVLGQATADERFLAVYNEALLGDDLIDRCEALALLVGKLASLRDKLTSLEESYALGALARQQLSTEIDELLQASADHYRAVRNVVRYLAHYEKGLAVDISERLNTAERREACIRDIALFDLDRPVGDVEWNWILRRVERLTRPYLRDVVVADACEVARRAPSGSLSKDQVQVLWELASAIGDSATRFLSRCNLHVYGIRSGVFTLEELSGTRAPILDTLELVDSRSERIDVGYAGVAQLAKHDNELARAVLQAVERTQGASPLSGMIPSFAYRDIVRLGIRAFGGLLAQGLAEEGPERALESLIGRVPATADQVALWTQLAMQYTRHRKSDSARAIVQRYVRPLLAALPQADREARHGAMLEAIPALFLANKTLTLEVLTATPAQDRNEYIQVLVNYLLHGVTVSDPYESVRGRAGNTDEDAILDVCTVLSQCESDVIIWDTCESIATAIAGGTLRVALTNERRADIANRLRAIVSSKLPHAEGICHDGPAIVAEAQIARIDMAGANVWTALAERARGISNHADRCLVLFTIAEILPRKEGVGRSKLIDEAHKAADAMPTSLDKIERLVSLAESLSTRDVEGAKRALKRAVSVARGIESERGARRAGRILDVAYRIDEGLAQALAKELDDDQGRVQARKRGQERLRLLEIKKRIGSGYYRSPDNRESISPRDYVRAADMALGALNAGIKRPTGLAAIREGGEIAATLPLDQAGPLYTWLVENVARTVVRSPETRASATAMFQAALSAAELTYRLVDRASGQRRESFAAASNEINIGMVAGAADRDRVFEFIRAWASENPARNVLVCDPYFGTKDLDVLELMSWVMPEAQFRVLTSRNHLEKEGLSYPYRDRFRQAWNSLADRDTPLIDIIIVGDARGFSPIHDRWILGDTEGLALGTSANSIGRTKLSQVRTLAPEEVAEVWRRLDPLLTRSARLFEGQKIEFDSFSL